MSLRSAATTTVAVGAAFLLAGCTTAPATAPPTPDMASAFGHIHGIVDLGDGTVLLGTHTGLYTINTDGVATGPIGGNDFDAMGLTGTKDLLYASGHPGPNTAQDLGSPNLGIIRSDDAGTEWKPAAFTGQEDFHVLTAAADGTVYGIGSSSPTVRASHDGGRTWTSGGAIAAADLTATTDGALYAATPDGLMRSRDGGATFSAVSGAPLLYQLEGDSAGGLVGVATDGVLWRLATGGGWARFGTVTGTVEALGVAKDGTVVFVDDRGIVRIRGTEVIVKKLTEPRP
ncbi:MAG: exo-alpha-sialidase [Microbacterium sp.]|nr:exo-alpha-sialidase [Microbacterium sp.]